jgi:hypothetical protein
MPNLARNKSSSKENTLPRFTETELGKEKLCIECQEYWPLDDEFWFTYKGKPKKDGTRGTYYEAACKCCWNTRYRPQLQGRKRLSIRSYHEMGADL